jgi:DNA-binding MarR family transcriptional regulator
VARNATLEHPVDKQLVGLLSHPLRFKILLILILRVATPKEIADELKAKLSDVSYHVKELVKLDFIEAVGEERRRWQIATLYRATIPGAAERSTWSNEEWAQLSQEERERYAAWANQLWIHDVACAIVGRTFQARPDAHTSRALYNVDDQGWGELNKIMDDALEASREVEVKSAERMREVGEDAKSIPVRAAMFCIEMPPGHEGK